MDRAQQILGGAALEQEAAGARAQRADDVLVLVEGREDEHTSVGQPCDQLAGGGDAIHLWHSDVHQHDVGVVVWRAAQRDVAVLGLGDDVERRVAGEDQAQPAADEVVVVDQHHADRAVRFGHGALGPWGSVARTSKRSPTRRASSVPPRSAARSRIPIRPWPAVVRAVAPLATGLATVSVSTPSRHSSASSAAPVPWRAALVIASCAMRYAARSIGGGSRSSGLVRSRSEKSRPAAWWRWTSAAMRSMPGSGSRAAGAPLRSPPRIASMSCTVSRAIASMVAISSRLRSG